MKKKYGFKRQRDAMRYTTQKTSTLETFLGGGVVLVNMFRKKRYPKSTTDTAA